MVKEHQEPDNKKEFLKMFKRKFKDNFEFYQDSFSLCNESKLTDYQRCIFVVYNQTELMDFFKLEKEGINVMLFLSNKYLHDCISFFDETTNLKLIDASKSRTEILNDLKSYFYSSRIAES